MSQEIHFQDLQEDEFIEFIDFEKARWNKELCAWVDRRFRVLPLDGYDTRNPRIDRIRDNIDVKNPVFYRR